MAPSPARGSRRRFGVRGVLLILAVLLFVALPAVAAFVIDWLWYGELGRTDVYARLVWGPWLLGAGAAVAAVAVLLANVLIVIRGASDLAWAEAGRLISERLAQRVDRYVRGAALWGGVLASVVIGLAIGRGAAASWPDVLLFLHAAPTGTTDPIFGQDVAFYLFRLPVWQSLVTLASGLLIVALVLTAAGYLLTRGVRLVSGGLPALSPAAQMHLSVLLALWFLVKAGGFLLARYALLYQSGQGFVGVGYTDVHARIPAEAIMAALAVLAAALTLVGVPRRNVLLPLAGAGLLIVGAILARGIYPAVVQRFTVQPNELGLEAPYIAHHIAFTRKAFGLDSARVAPDVTPSARVAADDVASGPSTIANVRLWDYRPLLQVYRQKQELRAYYRLADIDVDRYRINGQERQVMLSAREMDVDRLSEPNWINRHLIYTHGFGAVMSPVNEVGPSKTEPVYFLRDIPTESTVPELTVTQPRIYYGELTRNYVIVRTRPQNTPLPEFDYPSSGSEGNVYTTYDGRGGIPLANPLVRLLASVNQADINMLISSAVTPESRLLMRRDIASRVRALAPFLSYDRDPYMVVGDDGKLYWLMDGYTTSTRYPYARATGIPTADGTVRANYLHNPVKVVVDAYDGTVRFFLVKPDEPIIAAWARIFPGMFEPVDAMPAGLRAHLRFPEGQFNVLADIYASYHMTDPTVFYAQEDLWDVPRLTSGREESREMEGYYVVMALPGEARPEFLIVRPYTPTGKTNMIAWLSARNDPAHLGELVVLNFNKRAPVLGPQQIAARIDQDPEISAALTLWGQVGSNVHRGNLLAIPLGKSVLYAQPLYLQANQSQIPELQRVIVADQDRVVMRPTLAEALAALTGGAPPTAAPTTAPPTPAAPGAQPDAALRGRIRTAREHLDKAQQAAGKGDWATFGKEMEAARKALEGE